MNLNWFKIFNLTEFEALGLVSKTYTLDLSGVGEKEILVTKGNYVSILYDDVFLSLEMSEKNPFVFENTIIYLDSANDVWLGVTSAS